MVKQPGITLIELIIGLLISSVLITALFTIYGTITRTVARATERIDRDRAVAVFQNQWQKDIEGIFAPPYPEKEKKKKPEDKEKVEKETKEKAAVAQEAEKKEKPKPLKKIFESTTKEQSLDMLTFITSNPVAVYEKPQVGTIKPRIVRVIYRLEADKQKPVSYSLMRQESATLEFDTFKSKGPKGVKQYELLSRIKNLTVEFLVAEQKKEEKDKEEKKKEKKGKTFKTFKEWHSDERQKEEKEVPLIPEIIRTTLVLYDADKKGEFSYSFDYHIAAYDQKIVMQESTKAPMQPQQQQQQQKPGTQPQQPGNVPLPTFFFPQSSRITSLLDQIEKKLDEKLGMG